MNSLEDILAEYMRIRQHGLSVHEALLTLKTHVEPLDNVNRETLSQLIRSWEKGALSLEEVLNGDTNPPKTDQIIWIRCPNCDKKNRVKEVFCYNCGEILQKDSSTTVSSIESDDTEDIFPNEYFSDGSIIILDAQNADEHFELRPQLQESRITIGRGTQSRGATANVSFTSAQSVELGVSRLHVAIHFDKYQNVLRVEDLDSANGTFINNQRLYPKELRILCNRDELRLGRMLLHVKYLHPAELI